MVEVEHKVDQPLEAVTAKAKQNSQAVTAVTLDQEDIQVQEVAEVEPQQYTSMAQR